METLEKREEDKERIKEEKVEDWKQKQKQEMEKGKRKKNGVV